MSHLHHIKVYLKYMGLGQHASMKCTTLKEKPLFLHWIFLNMAEAAVLQLQLQLQRDLGQFREREKETTKKQNGTLRTEDNVFRRRCCCVPREHRLVNEVNLKLLNRGLQILQWFS